MKRIVITDPGCRVVYLLVGQTLYMADSGGCGDVLGERGVRLSVGMADETIADRVRKAWAKGYVGDPSDFSVRVETVED